MVVVINPNPKSTAKTTKAGHDKPDSLDYKAGSDRAPVPIGWVLSAPAALPTVFISAPAAGLPSDQPAGAGVALTPAAPEPVSAPQPPAPTDPPPADAPKLPTLPPVAPTLAGPEKAVADLNTAVTAAKTADAKIKAIQDAAPKTADERLAFFTAYAKANEDAMKASINRMTGDDKKNADELWKGYVDLTPPLPKEVRAARVIELSLLRDDKANPGGNLTGIQVNNLILNHLLPGVKEGTTNFQAGYFKSVLEDNLANLKSMTDGGQDATSFKQMMKDLGPVYNKYLTELNPDGKAQLATLFGAGPAGQTRLNTLLQEFRTAAGLPADSMANLTFAATPPAGGGAPPTGPSPDRALPPPGGTLPPLPGATPPVAAADPKAIVADIKKVDDNFKAAKPDAKAASADLVKVYQAINTLAPADKAAFLKENAAEIAEMRNKTLRGLADRIVPADGGDPKAFAENMAQLNTLWAAIPAADRATLPNGVKNYTATAFVNGTTSLLADAYTSKEAKPAPNTARYDEAVKSLQQGLASMPKEFKDAYKTALMTNASLTTTFEPHRQRLGLENNADNMMRTFLHLYLNGNDANRAWLSGYCRNSDLLQSEAHRYLVTRNGFKEQSITWSQLYNNLSDPSKAGAKAPTDAFLVNPTGKEIDDLDAYFAEQAKQSGSGPVTFEQAFKAHAGAADNANKLAEAMKNPTDPTALYNQIKELKQNNALLPAIAFRDQQIRGQSAPPASYDDVVERFKSHIPQPYQYTIWLNDLASPGKQAQAFANDLYKPAWESGNVGQFAKNMEPAKREALRRLLVNKANESDAAFTQFVDAAMQAGYGPGARQISDESVIRVTVMPALEPQPTPPPPNPTPPPPPGGSP